MTDRIRSGLADDLRECARKGASWLVDRVGPDGAPEGSDQRNAWWRLPWALAVSGQAGTASRILRWAEKNALDGEGDLRPGPFRKDPYLAPIYELTHLVIGAQLVGRYDLAELWMRRLAHFQHPKCGGGYHFRSRADEEQEWLLTTQIGLAGLVTGHLDAAHGTYRWLREVWAEQPRLDQQILFVTTRGSSPVVDFGEDEAWIRMVDFRKPRQAFYHPGAAAAFLADYAMRIADPAPLALARDMMQLNINGCSEQFDDRHSVQICKFGWGAARLLVADPDGGWLPHTVRMAEWFLERQEPGGSWIPSTFKVNGEPGDLDRMWKTAEHLMEVVQILVALGNHQV